MGPGRVSHWPGDLRVQSGSSVRVGERLLTPQALVYGVRLVGRPVHAAARVRDVMGIAPVVPGSLRRPRKEREPRNLLRPYKRQRTFEDQQGSENRGDDCQRSTLRSRDLARLDRHERILPDPARSSECRSADMARADCASWAAATRDRERPRTAHRGRLAGASSAYDTGGSGTPGQTQNSLPSGSAIAIHPGSGP